jgi:hypothetical protein
VADVSLDEERAYAPASGLSADSTVKDADLATLDAKLFTTATDAAANLIRKSKLSNSEYDVDELLRA